MRLVAMVEGVCFVSFCPNFGGVGSFQGYHLAHLAASTKTGLVDEFPAHSLERIDPSVRESIRVAEIPLWSKPATAGAAILKWIRDHEFAIVVINNPGVLVRYRAVFEQLRRDRVDLILVQHSGMVTMTPRRAALEFATSLIPSSGMETVYVSAFTRRYWERRYPWLRLRRARVVSNGVPVPSDRIALRPPRNVGFVGRVDQEKDAELFCIVAARSREAQSGMRFHLYGDGPLTSVLRQTYSRDVHFHGYVSNPGRIYSAIDLLLMPSHVENCPFALLEAKSWGVPTVAAPVGGIPEILENGVDGIFSADRSPAAFASALEVAKAKYARLAKGCLDNRSRFSIESVADQLWKPYLGRLRHGSNARPSLLPEESTG